MATLLVELLTEELPPKVLKKLGTAFGKGIVAQLTADNLVSETSDFAIFATPRRLAVTIDNVHDKSPEEIVNQRLMPKHVGFSQDGTPSDALIKKLKSIGLDASHAEKTETKTDGKLEFIFIRQNKEGITITEGLQKALDLSIANLPIPKVMTYQPQDSLASVSFVRPAHGLIAIHGDDVVHVRALGLDSGNRTLGHRFHSQGMITIKNAAEYEITMETEGHIIPSYEKRKSNIQNQLQNESSKLDLILHDDEALLDEVTALVESPKVYQAQFDKEFLSIPEECLILTMKTNQKYFPLFGRAGKLAEKFLLVSNMDLDDPSHIIEGNEKVVRPRLADAKFFYQGDMNTPLKELAEKLKNVVYHNKLGTQHDRVIRLGKLSKRIGEQSGSRSWQRNKGCRAL
jgi:glycyl-tRNA synthetase beta chain